MFEHLVQDARPWLEHYGYTAVFAAMFLEGFGVPAPALTLLIAAVIMASQDELRIVPVVGLATLGILAGCQLAYVIGRTGGRRLLLRSGVVNPRHLRRLHDLLARRGAILLIAAPFFDGTRQYGSLAAGTADLAWHRFTRYNLTGIILWIGTWSTATDVFGHHLEPVLSLVHRSGPFLVGAVLAILAGLIVYRLFRHGRAS
jgi:membrane protein DedA with SNARE-associated domain